MHNWRRSDPTTVTQVGWRTITSKTFQLPDGTEKVFDTTYRDGQQFVSIVAITRDNKAIVARQFRPGPEKVFDEMPGGFVDDNEEPIDAAKRELQEETGYIAGSIELLGRYADDAYTNAWSYGFIAYDCEKVSTQNLDPGEIIEVDLISLPDLLTRAKTGAMTDMQVVLMAYDHILQRCTE